MKLRILTLIACLIGSNNSVLASSEIDPSVDVSAVALQLALRSARLRDEGWPKEPLLQAIQDEVGLPERVRIEARQIVEDLYAHPEVAGHIYSVYTAVRFQRESRGLSVPRDFGQLAAPVVACQEAGIPQDSVELTICVMQAFKTLDTVSAPTSMHAANQALTESQLTAQEADVIASAGVDPTLVAKLKRHGVGVERLMALTPDYDEVPASGIVISTPPGGGRDVLLKIRSELASSEFRAYLSVDGSGIAPDKVAIVKTDDDGFLAIVRTEGLNHDIKHERVLERFSEWKEKYGLELVGAGQDWLEARVTRPPNDWKAFAAEVYEFSPDVVHQGAGNIDALADEMKAGSLVYLWWD